MKLDPIWMTAVLYLAFRALVLHSGFDTVAIPSFEVTNIGSLAQMTSEGRSGIPLYLYFDNCGGHLVTGLLGGPLYALFGDSYAVLKLVPILLGLGSLILIWRILERHASRPAAALGALLFALGPPTLTKFSMLAQGNHFENVFFQLATYALFLRLHDRGATPGRIFALGASAGFAFFFYFGSAAILLGLVVSHGASRGARCAFADLRFALPGFLVGFSPLVALAFAPNHQVQRFLAGKADAITGSTGKTFDFLSSVLPQAGGFEDLGPLPGGVAEILYLACFALAWILGAIALVRAIRPAGSLEIARLGPLLLHLPIVVIVLSLTPFQFGRYGPPVEFGGYRYLVPHFAFAALLIPFGVEQLMRRSRRSAARGLLAGSAATCLFTLPLLAGAGSEKGLAARYAGFVPRFLSAIVLHDWDRDPVTKRRVWDHARIARRLEDLSAWERHGAMEGVGHMLSWEDVLPPGRVRGEPLAPLPLRELAGSYAEPYAIDIARGAGSFLRRCALTMQARAKVPRALREILDSKDPLAPYVVEGLCLEYSYPLARQTARDLEASRALRELVPAEHREAWARGFGLQCGRLMGRGIPADVATVLSHAQEIDAAEAEAFWTGIGWGLADWDEEIPDAPELEHVPPEHHASTRAGFSASAARK
ncbi:MAG: glycosyltransferase family 39 protein [Planctomycetota bacterium]